MSSDSEITVDYENVSKIIISEVEKRPALYDKSLKQFRDRNIKARLWEEVYQHVCREWPRLSEAEKKNKGNFIQKKWKNMKDCFAKELVIQQGKSGQSPPKKKKYRHFDSMLFLIPSMQKRETSSNVVSFSTPDVNLPSSDSTQDVKLSTLVGNSYSTNEYRKALRKNCYDDDYTREYEKQSLELKGKQQQDDDDEEKHFALKALR
ncbi:uncharacterized protein [Epargyreus clarus]|uniref:uncharacterized protein n=1 Tax=Epargyreus clarus TaxID=520877 RepID=UPI003C2DBEAA